MIHKFITGQVHEYSQEHPSPNQWCLVECWPWVDLNESMVFIGVLEYDQWKVLHWIKTPALSINLREKYDPTIKDTYVILDDMVSGEPVEQPEHEPNDILKRLEELEKKVKDIPQQPAMPYPVYPPYQPYVPVEPVPAWPPQIWYHTVTPAGPGYYKDFQTISSAQKG